MLAADYAPHFHLSLMQKDLEYALKEAEQSGVTLSTARPAIDAFRRAVSSGHGMQDASAVIEPLRE
jgi:3-hydroxyisobutyrate dehydrogenase-like beta-hydroxyacid dehydrogenase